MQQMHQSYKCMRAQQKKLVGVHPTRLLMKTQGILRKPIIGIYKPSSIMKNTHQYMNVTTQETLYHEDHGATLKHKCGKKDSSIAPFYGLLFFFGLSLFWDNALLNDDHHTSIYLQLKNYNSILDQHMTLCECLRRCIGICNEARVTCMKEL